MTRNQPESVEKINPESLFLFLSLKFEGMAILEGLRENQLETVMPRGLSRHSIQCVKPQKVCRQAQQKSV